MITLTSMLGAAANAATLASAFHPAGTTTAPIPIPIPPPPGAPPTLYGTGSGLPTIRNQFRAAWNGDLDAARTILTAQSANHTAASKQIYRVAEAYLRQRRPAVVAAAEGHPLTRPAAVPAPAPAPKPTILVEPSGPAPQGFIDQYNAIASGGGPTKTSSAPSGCTKCAHKQAAASAPNAQLVGASAPAAAAAPSGIATSSIAGGLSLASLTGAQLAMLGVLLVIIILGLLLEPKRKRK